MLSREFNRLLYDYRVVIFLLICLTAQFIGWRMWLRLVKAKTARYIVHATFIVFNSGWLFTVSALYFGGNLTDFTWSWVGRPSVSWQEVYLFVMLPLSFLGYLAFKVFYGLSKNDVNISRRDFIKRASGTAGALAILGTCGYGVLRQSMLPKITRYALDIDGLPAQLDGFVIAHITDLHLGLWASQKELDNAVRVIAAEKPDLVAFTGDMIDRSPDNAKLYHEPLKYLQDTPYGVWGVLGNHDHYTGAPLAVAEYLSEGGLDMLIDRQVNLPKIPLSIIGLDDQGTHKSWLGQGLSLNKKKDDPDVLNFNSVQGPELEPDNFIILLNHRPEGFAQAARHGCQLYLAGHTHGGQYRPPYNNQFNLAAVFYKYSSGLYHEHEAWLHVSPGIASVGVPFRLWAWPEVSLITLKRRL